mmetsp:Transcript_17244/g.23966  ORF Transcript_17244/g.23966 Transcript_17244/m.23966 type:complete len:506 (-) Transcript_17244:27-1544(-)
MAMIINPNDIPYDSEEDNETFNLDEFIHPHDFSFRIAFKNLKTSKTKEFFVENSNLWKHTELLSFSVCSCTLQTIPSYITQLKNLQTITLTGNDITSLPEELCQLINLQKLNLSRNKITQVPESLFTHCTQITDLQCIGNQNLKVPESINHLHNLKILSLSSCRLGSFPNAVIHLPCLSELNMYDNLIDSMPSVPFQLKNLESLQLGRNSFKSFPYSKHVTNAPNLAEALPKLKKLYIEANQIAFLHESIGQLTTLEVLDISSNKITDLSALVPLAQLQQLLLALNRIKEVPDPLWQNENLKHIDVSYNDIAVIPEHLDKHPSLLLAKIFGNIIETYPPATADPKRFCIKDIRGPDRILPRLYLGSLQNARNKHTLKRLGVTHIVTVMPDSDCLYTEDFHYHIVAIEDDHRENIAQYFAKCHEFMDNALSDERNAVFVHCAAGISRSSTMVISYLMAKQKMSFTDAYQHVKSQRQIISPNQGFQQQLKHFEKELHKDGSKECVIM